MEKRTSSEVNDLANSLIKDPKVLKVWSYWKAKYSKFMDEDEVESSIMEGFRRALINHDFSRQQFHSTFVRYLKWEFDREVRRKLTKENLVNFSPLNPNSVGREPQEISEESQIKFSITRSWMDRFLTSEVKNTIDKVYLRGYTIAQVAKEENCSESAVANKLAYGIKKLREVSQLQEKNL